MKHMVNLPIIDERPILRSVFILCFCYLVGIICGGILFSLYGGVIAIVSAVAGLFIALPFLFISVIVLLLFRISIKNYLAIWCICAPLVLAIVWLIAEYVTSYSQRGFSLVGYLLIRNVIERAVMVVIMASLAAFLFYIIERREA